MKLIYVDSYEFSNLRALCLLRIRKHIWTYHLIFLCFGKVVWKRLEVIPQLASDTSQLTDYAPSPMTLSDPAAHAFLPSRST